MKLKIQRSLTLSLCAYLVAVILVFSFDRGGHFPLWPFAFLIGVISSFLLILSCLIFFNFFGRRPNAVFVVAVLLPVVVFGGMYLRNWVSEEMPEAISKVQAARMELVYMKIEELLSKKGNLIGMRVSYAVKMPQGSTISVADGPSPYGLEAWIPPSRELWSQQGVPSRFFSSMGFRNSNYRCDTCPPPGQQYESGETYTFTVDMIPEVLPENAFKEGACLEPDWHRRLPSLLSSLKFDISTVAVNEHVQVYLSKPNYQGQSQRKYNTKTFYENALKELQQGECPPKKRNGPGRDIKGSLISQP